MATVIFDSDIFFPCEMVSYAAGLSLETSKLNWLTIYVIILKIKISNSYF